MDVIVERCAGLDVHRDSVVATVRVPGTGKSRRRRAQQTHTFGTTIAQLEQLADWLEGFGVTLVGMEATGVYWKPVFSVLERRFECWLINAEHLHNVPGRKSDVIDSRWLCELLELGLVRPSFVPPPEIRRLRDLTRLRSTQAEERTRAIQRLEKVLQDAGIKLTSVASKTYSVSARAMLEALLGGVSDPACLAELAKGRLRAKIPQLQEALANRFDTAHHGVLVAGLLAHIDALDQAVATLDARIAAATDAELINLLSTIPGVKRHIAEVLIAECGLDMSVFGSAQRLVSWAAICPGTNQSGHRRRSGKTRRGNRWLRTALTQAAHAAARSKNTYLASHYWQIRGRRGDAKAIGATRHDILIAYYHIVSDRVPFRELGPDWLARRHSPEHRTRRLVKQLEALGHTVTLDTAA
jgi:transposase